MIVAEFCDLITKSLSKNEKGALPFNLGSYYNEFQIINYLGEDIQALDFQNRVVTIKPQEGSPVPRADDRKIIIQYRYVSGPRQMGSQGIEMTPSAYCTMVIPRSVLLEAPVFVEEINALLFCPRWHPNTNLHPHSVQAIALRHDRLRSEIGRNAVFSPITIMANDPTGQIKALHIELNGQICSVKVTNFNTDENEVDVIAMCIRSTSNGLVDDCKIIRTTFAQLIREQDPRCWTIGGFTISSDRVWLENKLEIERNRPGPKVIPVDDVNKLIKEAKAEDVIVIGNLSEIITQKDRELKEVRGQYTTLSRSYDDLIKNGHLERSSTVQIRKLDFEEKKLTTSIEEAKLAHKNERLKLTKEQISTLGTIAKTIAVFVPLVILYIKYKQQKPTS